MGIFALIDNGVVSNVIVADQWENGIDVSNLYPHPGPGWKYDGGTFTPPSAVLLGGGDRRIPKYDVRRALTLPEKIALASKTTLQGEPLNAQGIAICTAVEADYNVAPDPINIDDPDFITGMSALVSIGVLGSDVLNRIRGG